MWQREHVRIASGSNSCWEKYLHLVCDSSSNMIVSEKNKCEKPKNKSEKKVRIFIEPGEEADIEVGNGENGGTWGEGARGYAEARIQVGLWRIRRSMRSIRRSFVFIVSF